MKILILILTISTVLLASTHYRTPNLVVEKSNLYCTDRYGEHITIYPTGDIVDGEVAANYCSYNKSTVIKKMEYISTHTNKKFDETIHLFLKYILLFLIGLLIFLIFKTIKNYNK